MMQEILAQEGDTLDYLIFRVHGIVTDATLEAAYELNPELVHSGLTLTAGTAVRIPELPSVPVKPTIKLYD